MRVSRVTFVEVIAAVVRLFQTRRSSSNDSANKQRIRETASVLADILVKHLEQKDFSA